MKKKIILLEKRQKKEQKKFFQSQRVENGMNTGVRTFKSKKDYERKWKIKDYE